MERIAGTRHHDPQPPSRSGYALMPAPLLPPEADLTIGFAHVAYHLGQEFATRGSSARVRRQMI